MVITTESDLARLRLLHLVSPSLPVGAFTYSQGLEWAVECDWIDDEASLREWIGSLMQTSMTYLDLPILARLYPASAANDRSALRHWSHYLIASRETKELREEEHNRGRALAALLPELGVPVTADHLPLFKRCQLTGFAHAARYWQIPLRSAAAGYLWGWLENITLAGVKIIPLGQTAGQRIIAELTAAIPERVQIGLHVADEAIGASCAAQAIASSLHETQYTRIYRS
jgi:urease accessory protein